MPQNPSLGSSFDYNAGDIFSPAFFFKKYGKNYADEYYIYVNIAIALETVLKMFLQAR